MRVLRFLILLFGSLLLVRSLWYHNSMAVALAVSMLMRETFLNDSPNNDRGSYSVDEIPSKFAFVYMGNEDHFSKVRSGNRFTCPSIYDSLRALGKHFPITQEGIPEPEVIILYDKELSNATCEDLKEASRFPMSFHKIIFDNPRDAQWANITDIQYKRMCAFWFHYFFELTFLPDYVMRLDTDSCVTSDMVVNPFQYMQTNKLDYMYNAMFLEPPFVIEGLKDFIHKHPGHPVNNNTALSLWPKDDPEAMNVFSTNIEWFYMPAFQQQHILDWKEEVRQDGGIFHHRWGDAPLRTIVGTTLLNSSRIARFCTFSYNHSIWEPFTACVDNRDGLVEEFGWNIVDQTGTTTFHG